MAIPTPTAYWKADESSGNYADSIGSNTGTPTGTSYVSGKINNGISLSGGTSYVTLTNLLSTVWDNSYTLSMWVKPTTLDTTNGDLLLWPGDRNQQHIIDTTGKLVITTFDGAVANVVGNTSLANGNWYHVVYQRTSSTTGKVFLNGSDDTSGTNAMKASPANPGHSFRFGSRQDNTAANFNGLIDEIGIWNSALTSGQISELYNGGTGIQYPFISGTKSAFLAFMR